MNKTAIALLLSTATVSMGACGSGAATTASSAGSDPGTEARDGAGDGMVSETRTVPPFSSVALNGIGTVRIHRGPQEVRVSIDENLIDRFETEVKGDTLMVGFRCGFSLSWLKAVRNLKQCEIDIWVPELDGVEVNGAGTITVDPFAYEDIEVKITGDGTIELHGSAARFSVFSTGSAKVNAGDLAARTVSVRMTGAGMVELRAEESLDASVTGAGTLAYWGTPALTQRISGAGTIKRMGE